MSLSTNNNSNRALLKWWEALAIFVLCFALYGNSIQNDYNIDDAYIVPLDEQNEVIKEGWSAILKLIFSRYNVGEGVTYGYRPMGKITMVLEYMIWGNNPHNSHIVNIILYAINIAVLLILLRMLAIIGIKISDEVLYIGLLLFLFHPIHTEVVCSIKNREELLCFTFLALALICVLQFFKTKKLLTLLPFAVTLLISLFSKQTAINIFGWLLLIGITNLFLKKEAFRNRRLIFGYVLFILISILFYNIVYSIIPELFLEETNSLYSFEQNPYHFLPASQSIPNGLGTILFYLKKLFVPVPLVFYYGYDMLPAKQWSSPSTIFGLALFFATVTYVVYTVSKKRALDAAFFIAVFAVSIFPFANLLKPAYVTGIVGERLVYQASFAFCMFIPITINQLQKSIFKTHILENKTWKTALYALPVIIFFSAIVLQRNLVWKNKETLYKNDIKHLENSARANFMIANTYMKQFQKNKAIKFANIAQEHFARAIQVYPDYSEAKLKLGLVNLKYLNRSNEGIQILNSIRNDSTKNFLYAQELIGDYFKLKTNNQTEALKYYLVFWQIDKTDKVIYQKIQDINFKQGNMEAVLEVSKQAAANNWHQVYIDAGDAYKNLEQMEAAMKNYKIAIEMGFKNQDLESKVNEYFK